MHQNMILLAAPLQGFTERCFRRAHALVIGGIAEYYTPFARLEKGQLRSRDLADLQPDQDLPAVTVPQILVKTREETLALADLVCQRGFSRLDINAGCPFPKVAGAGYGAGLLATPDRLTEVLHAATSISQLSVSLKLRLPTPCTPENLQELASRLNDLPLRHVVLHPRLQAQQYAPPTHVEAFQAFRGLLHHRLFYNGDVLCSTQPLPADHLMLGRGLLQNPLLPRELQGDAYSPVRRQALLRAFHQALLENLANTIQQPLPKLKTYWEWLLPDTAKSLRKKVLKSVTMDDYQAAVEHLLQAL